MPVLPPAHSLGMFLKGTTIGFSIAAPVGPIGLLCIRRSLVEGLLPGLATGLGAATADAAYGFVAGFGLTAVSGFLVRQQLWLSLFGGAFLCYLGWRTAIAKPALAQPQASPVGLVPAFGSTFLLTLANPITILSFVAVFASFGLGTGGAPDYRAACELVGGVFIGSAVWWLLLSSSIGLVRARVNLSALRFINYLSGGILLAFGIVAIVRLLLR